MSKLGRNQAIAAIGFSVPLVATLALVIIGKVSGAEWIDFASSYTPTALATILGISGAIKVASTLRGSPRE